MTEEDTYISPEPAETTATGTDPTGSDQEDFEEFNADEVVATIHVRGEGSWEMEMLTEGETMTITDERGRLIAQIETEE